MWKSIASAYWQVLTFKRSPADTPYSIFVLRCIALLYVLFTVFQWRLSELRSKLDFVAMLVLILGFLSVYILYTFFILRINNKSNRFVQTLSSLLACHLIIHVIALPLLLFSPHLGPLSGPEAEANVNSLVMGLYLMIPLMLTIWQFLITAFIYRKALEIDFLSSILFSFGLSLCNLLVIWIL